MLQAVSIEIYNNSLVHVVTCVYNPPALITNNLIDHICLKFHFVIFVGDFNYPFLTENFNIIPYNKFSALVDKILNLGYNNLFMNPGHNILDMVCCSELFLIKMERFYHHSHLVIIVH